MKTESEKSPQCHQCLLSPLRMYRGERRLSLSPLQNLQEFLSRRTGVRAATEIPFKSHVSTLPFSHRPPPQMKRARARYPRERNLLLRQWTPCQWHQPRHSRATHRPPASSSTTGRATKRTRGRKRTAKTSAPNPARKDSTHLLLTLSQPRPSARCSHHRSAMPWPATRTSGSGTKVKVEAVKTKRRH